MDIEAYISSGILEAYVLGNASDKERREVECLSSIHEEIAKELEAIRSSMESYALAEAVTPPAALRDRILQELEDKPKVIQMETPVAEPHADAKLGQPAQTGGGIMWRVAAAVAVLIAAGFFAMFLETRSDVDGVREQLAAISDSKQELQLEVEALRAQVNQNEELLAFFQHDATHGVRMPGVPTKAPDAYATVFWNTQNSNAYLKVSYLPEPPAGKQYQLWGIVEGKPMSMGVFDVEKDTLQRVPDINNVQAFAVTLEPIGGSVDPTLEEMYVLGEV